MRILGWLGSSPDSGAPLEEQGVESRDQLTALTEICHILTSERDFGLKCTRVLEALAEISESDFAILRELDPDGIALRQVAVCGDVNGSPTFSVPLSTRSKMTSKSFVDDRPLVIGDYAASENPHQGYLDVGFKSLAVVPINFDGAFLGTLGFASKSLHHYNHELVRLLTALTRPVGILMANAKLMQEREVEANIGRIVSSPLDASDVFERFKAELTKIIPVDRLVINSIDLADETFTRRFHYGGTIPGFDDSVPSPYTGTLTEIIVTKGAGDIVNEGDPRLSNGEFEVIQRFLKRGYRSFMGVPLIFGDQIVGGLSVCRFNQPFTKEELARAERIGNMLSGTLANYNLDVEIRQAELESQESSARFKQIAEHISGAFWLINMRPREVLYVSPRVEQVWGLTAEQLYEDSFAWLSLVHPDDLERVAKSAHSVAETGELNEEFRIIRKDGSVRWVHNRGFPIDDEAGNFYRMGGIIEDVTEERQTAQELAEARRLASIGELSAGVAHEINNPLTSIVLYSRSLLDQELPDDIRDDIQVVSSQADRAVRVVKNLLEFARKAEPAPQNLSLGTLLRRTLEMKSYDFRLSNITVVQEIPEVLPLSSVDEHMMIQVFLNVLNNAEHACAGVNEGGTIRVTAFETQSGGNIRISIKDNGPGVPEDRLSKIFEPFYTTKEVGFGTGLGLSVSHGVIAQHGGRIWAENSHGGGATFHIEVPNADRSPDNRDTEGGDPVEDPAEGGKEKGRVLVVDDEPAIRTVLARHLQKCNYEVDLASGGEEAWRKIQDCAYDCILLDLRMPRMSGQALYESVKAAGLEAASRIIFISGDTGNPASQGFLRSVPNYIVSKPFDFNDVLKRVAEVALRSVEAGKS